MNLIKKLDEMYGGVRGLDNYDRAIEMINAAVEQHERNDNFQAIADIDGLVQYLQSHYHDFTPALEDTVRQIIADEMGSDSDMWEEEEKKTRPVPRQAPTGARKGAKPKAKLCPSCKGAGTLWQFGPDCEECGGSGHVGGWKSRDTFQRKDRKWHFGQEEEEKKTWHPGSGEFPPPEVRAKDPWLTNKLSGRGMANYYGAKMKNKKRAKHEEEESRLERFKRERDEFWKEHNKRKQARKYGVSGPSGRRSRLGSRARGRLTSTEQEEVTSLSDRRTRRDRFSPDVRKNRRGYRHGDPRRRHAELMARKARPHVGLEQEEKTDWNKEVEEFRKRRKHYEPEGARSGRLGRKRRRQPSGPSGNAFGLRFESFKSFLEKEDETSGSK